MKRILIIDDEKTLREEIGEILTFEGYETLLAENGKVGLEMAQIHCPDLILCDIMMPEMDGKRVLYELRAQEKTTLTPFIFMSALSERQYVRNGMELGADDYLTKPFNSQELLHTIQARLKKQEARIKMTYRALESLRSKIMTTLPHELRTPLSSIIGFGSLLNDIGDLLTPKEISDMGGEILNSGNRLHRLIENYLISVQLQLNDALDQGNIPGSVIEPVINEITQTLSRKYERELLPEISIEQTDRIAISESFLRKIVLELIDNAYKFSKTTSPVWIKGENKDGFYQLIIKDQGRGMSPGQISQLGAFMQFNREDKEQQGSGLGLSIAKKMIESSGGIFSLESQTDEGVEVKILIPR